MGAGDQAQDSPHQHLQDNKEYHPGRQVSIADHLYQQCCGSTEILVRTRTADPYLVCDLIRYFLNVHLHHFSKIKVIKKSQNSRNQCFSYYFCLMVEGSGARSGSISLTNGSGFGSGRPRNIWILRIWIRIRISNTAYRYLVTSFCYGSGPFA